LKVLGSADGDEGEDTLTAMLGRVLAGRGSPAKQPGNEKQIVAKYTTEAAAKTPFSHIFAIDFRRCDRRANDFI
jgi:hypothetical protein